MYQSYWNLSRSPFECDLDVDFYHETGSHAAALLKLQYLIEQCKGAGVLAAGSGMGKTYLTHVLEKRLGEVSGPVVRMLYPRLEPAGLLAQIAVRLGVTPGEVDSMSVGTDRIIERLRTRLVAICRGGRKPVIIIDDAHMIDSPEVWHCLRLLMNFREADGIDFTLLLVGQPQLLGHLRQYGDLYDRLAVRVSLAPLTEDDVNEYVTRRLSVAGSEEDVFIPEAVSLLTDLSGGVPRKINQMADLTLLVGYADRLERITDAEMSAASEEMQIASVD